MGFFGNLLLRLRKDTLEVPHTAEIQITHKFDEAYSETYMNYLAFYSNVNRIANAFCKCSIETYQNNEQIRGSEWYVWNIQPNKNQSSYDFKNKLINTLYEKNEALVIELNNGDLYVADDYVHEEFLFVEDTFNNIHIRNMSLSRTYRQSEVLFFKLNDVNIKLLIDGISDMTQRLLRIAWESYEDSKSEKMIIDIDETAKGSDDFVEEYTKLMEQDFKNYFESKKAVLPLFNGYEINDRSKSPDYSTTPKEILDIMNYAVETNAIAMNIPLSLAKGNVSDTSKVIDEFLTFCIDPLVTMIREEITRKRYGEEEISKGNYIKINSTTIKHIDIFDISASIEKLVSSACFTVNDIRRALGMPEINEEWANEFFMTKNFSTVEDLMNALKGGDMSA